jgi:DNA excision repair protein ERCC-2
MFGVPYQYTLSRILQARLEYLEKTFQIKDSDFLAFDAVRQASQCVGRVIRSKADYGMMIFADKRYQRHDKRDKLPRWITSHLSNAHLDLSTDMLVHIAREFMRNMAQPLAPAAIGKALLSAEDLEQRSTTALPTTVAQSLKTAPIVAPTVAGSLPGRHTAEPSRLGNAGMGEPMDIG